MIRLVFLTYVYKNKGLICNLASLFVIFIREECLSISAFITFKSIPTEVSGLSCFDFNVSYQPSCRSLLKSSWFSIFRFLLNCICLLYFILRDLLVYTNNCASWFDIGLVSLPPVIFSSVLLSKILSVRAFVQVVSLAAIVILGKREFEYFVKKFLVW